MDEFYCNETQMNTVKTNTESMREEMAAALSLAEKLQGEIGKSSWSGRQKDTIVAFMDLMVQYHKSLVTDGRNPLDAMYTSLEKFCTSLNEFYDDFEEYNELEGIK